MSRNAQQFFVIAGAAVAASLAVYAAYNYYAESDTTSRRKQVHYIAAGKSAPEVHGIAHTEAAVRAAVHDVAVQLRIPGSNPAAQTTKPSKPQQNQQQQQQHVQQQQQQKLQDARRKRSADEIDEETENEREEDGVDIVTPGAKQQQQQQQHYLKSKHGHDAIAVLWDQAFHVFFAGIVLLILMLVDAWLVETRGLRLAEATGLHSVVMAVQSFLRETLF